MAKAKNPEVTSKKLGTLASQALQDPNASKREKSLAGALLTQMPDLPKPAPKPVPKVTPKAPIKKK